jgi:hypothetical protein
MFEQTEVDLIASIFETEEVVRTAKVNLQKLAKIKEKYTGVKEKDCFCSSVRRKIWFKVFKLWYESNT